MAQFSGPRIGWPSALYASVGRWLTRYVVQADGHISVQARQELPLNAQYACFHPKQPILYIACSNGGVLSPGDKHCLVQLGVGGDSMEPLAEPVQLPYRPLHAAIDLSEGRFALAYNRPAAISLHALDVSGVVHKTIALHGEEDLVGHFPHQVLPVPGRPEWLLTCRGDDATPDCAENPGSLRLLSGGNRSLSCARVTAPNGGFGFGPRNSAFHPHLPVLYSILERQNQVAAFRHADGVLEAQPSWTVGLLQQPERLRRPQLAGAVVIHPSGRFAYVVNRAHPALASPDPAQLCGENSVVVLALDTTTGEPRELQRVALPGLHARCISLSHDGRILIAAMRQPGCSEDVERGLIQEPAGFVCFEVQDSGHLLFLQHHAVDVGGEQLFWAEFSPPYVLDCKDQGNAGRGATRQSPGPP